MSQESLVYCEACGKQLSASARFCRYCGGSNSDTNAAEHLAAAPIESEMRAEPRRYQAPRAPDFSWTQFLAYSSLGVTASFLWHVLRGAALHPDRFNLVLGFSITKALLLYVLVAIIFCVILAFRRFRIAEGKGIFWFCAFLYGVVTWSQVTAYSGF